MLNVKMPVDVQTWRVRVGAYNAGRLSAFRSRYGRPKSIEKMKGSDVAGGCGTVLFGLVMVLSLLHDLFRGRLDLSAFIGTIRVRCGSSKWVSSMKMVNVACGVAVLLFVLAMALCLLLLLAGDVERNPGPNGGNLTIKDLPLLVEKLNEIAGQWHTLGVQLKFLPGTLDGFPPAVQADPTRALQQLLTRWLQRKDPRPTLEALSEAVGGPVIGNEVLAGTLLKQREDFPSIHGWKTAFHGDTDNQATLEAPSEAVGGPVIGNEVLAGTLLKQREDFPSIHGWKTAFHGDTDNQASASIDTNASANTNGTAGQAFWCPCGKCSLDSFLKVGCPQVSLSSSSRLSFPYLDTSELDEDDRSDLEHKLIRDTSYIIKKFDSLVMSTSSSLIEQGITHQQLANCVVHLEGFVADIGQNIVGDHEDEIMQGGSIDGIFLILRKYRYWSFLNCEILQQIINTFGNEKLKESLQKYLSDFKDFCKRSVFQVPSEVFTKKTTKKTFAVKLVETVRNTLEDVLQARRKIAEALGMRSTALFLCCVEKGCVKVHFLIPDCIAKKVLPPSRDQLAALHEASVQFLEFDGKQYICQELPSQESEVATDAKALYEEALEKGYVSTGIIKMIVLGHAGSGKTHVKFLILKKHPPPIRCSTSLAENPIRAISQTRVGRVGGGDEEEEWIEVTLKELLQIIADSLRTGVTLEEIEKVVRVETINSPQESDTAGGTEDTEGSRGDGAEISTAPVSPDKELEPLLATKGIPASTTVPSNSEAVTMECHASASIEELEEDMIKLMENSSGSRKLHDFQWVYFIDTGGQPQFCDLLPTFIKGTHMILFVLKLPERLDECPTIAYYDNKGNPCSQPCKSSLQNDQIFQNCIRTMCSTDEESPNAFPKVAVVGTHKDKEHLCTETREEKNSTLLRMCRPVSKKVIYYGQEMKDMIFPVNAKTPQKEDHKVAAQLRRAIIQEAERIEPAKIPIPWYMLEQGIRRLTIKLGRSIVTTSECLAVARRLHLSDSHFNAALEFFHNLNTFLYYPDHLPNAIFSEPQALLDKLSELVQRAYELRDEPTKAAITGEWLEFRDYGYITPRHLGRFSSHYFDPVFTPTKLLHLLEGLLVIAQVSEDTYFMPSLLRTIKHKDVQRSPQTSSTPAPLLIRFSRGCARNGVYPSLVVYLLSHSNPTPWKIAYRFGNPICISGNCIKFQFPKSPCIIQLADSFSYFEVHISGPPEEISPQLCSVVKETIFTGIKTVCTALHYTDSQPEVAFFCSAEECSKEAIHYATISGSGFLLLCSENPTEVYPSLRKQHIIWLDRSHSSSTSEPCTIDKMPRLAQLMTLKTSEGQKVKIIESIAPNWKQLGICLDFDPHGHTLDLIEAEQKQNGPIDCCQQMFKHWLGGNGKAATWGVLLGLLEDIHQTNLAIRIRIALNSLAE